MDKGDLPEDEKDSESPKRRFTGLDLGVRVVEMNPIALLLQRLYLRAWELPDEIRKAIDPARELAENWVNATAIIHLESGAELLLDQLIATGLYGMDREEACIRLICEGLERRMAPIKLEDPDG